MTKNKTLRMGLVFTLALCFIIALSLVASATSVVTPVDTNVEYANVMGYAGYVDYGNLSGGNFNVLGVEAYYFDASNNMQYNYVTIIDNIEAFQTRYSTYSYMQYISEVENAYFDAVNNQAFSDALYWLAYNVNQTTFEYLQTYEVVDAEQIRSEVWNSVSENLEDYAISQDILHEPNTITGVNSLNGWLADNVTYELNELDAIITEKQNDINDLDELVTEQIIEIERLKGQNQDYYTSGYNDGMTEAQALEKGVKSVVSAPIYVISNLLDFNVFGVNLFALFASIITILVIAFVIKKLSN